MRFGQGATPGDLVRVGLKCLWDFAAQRISGEVPPGDDPENESCPGPLLRAGPEYQLRKNFVTPGEMKVATLCAGYGDGIQPTFIGSGNGCLDRGTPVPALGRVTMDQVMVDVTHLERVEPGDEVVLIGRQGDQEILASELATKAGTIAWEIFTGITKRVVRITLRQAGNLSLSPRTSQPLSA